jgi:hypothetical protein
VDDHVALRPRLALAFATIVGVASGELGVMFCFNARLAMTGLLTSTLVLLPLFVVAMARIGARGGFLVGLTSLGCLPIVAMFAQWEARGFRAAPTSDFEDFLLLVLLVGGFAVAARFAVRRTRTGFSTTLCTATRALFVAALVLSVVLLVGGIARAVRRPVEAPALPVGIIVAAAVGIGLAIAFGVAARRARATHEALASGVVGVHKGAGWLELDDGQPPIHRPDLASCPDGPVVVCGRTTTTTQGYRGTPNPEAASLTVTFGTPESIRGGGTSHAASQHAIAAAVLAFSVVPLLMYLILFR